MRILPTAFTVVALAAPGAWAVDDNFDPSKYDKGGFAPITNALYSKECGSCHFAYLPGMLPARSWHALLAASERHFGEALSLSPPLAKELETYLAENAADRSDFRGSALMLYRLAGDIAPTRITALPLMRQRHVVVRELMLVGGSPVKRLTNCDGCHEGASTGSFAYKNIVVPGVTKLVKPNGVF
jgi:hypothetical protein